MSDYTDLIARLRAAYAVLTADNWHTEAAAANEAADALEAMQKRVRELEVVIYQCESPPPSCWEVAEALARQASEKQP